MVFNRVHHKSCKWLNNDSHVGHVTQGELGRHHSRLMSCLGQWVIDTMVGMDKVCCTACTRCGQNVISSSSSKYMLCESSLESEWLSNYSYLYECH